MILKFEHHLFHCNEHRRKQMFAGALAEWLVKTGVAVG